MTINARGHAALLATLLATATLAACTATPQPQPSADDDERRALTTVDRDNQRARARVSAEAPDATQNGNIAAEVAPIGDSFGFNIAPTELTAHLYEAAGAEVLTEIALERLLRERCLDEGIELNDQRIADERRAIARAFAEVTRQSIDADDAPSTQRLLDTVRARRGLGPARFDALVRRQAMMRALVADDVRVTDEQLRLAHALRYGPRADIRIITTNRIDQAQRAARRIRDGEPFAAVAAELSTDPSAANAGRIDTIALADQALPAAVRDAVNERLQHAASLGLTRGSLDQQGLTVDQRLSDAVRIDNGYALILLDRPYPPDPVPIASVADELTALMQRRQERLLMERLARDIIQQARIRPADPSLRWAWNTREERR